MLTEYMAALANVALLSPEEEQALWFAYKEQGEEEARSTLIESYQPLVFKEALRWNLQESLRLDLLQEGTVGLIEATERYDHRLGVAFSLYARHRIRGRMLDYLKRDGSLIPMDEKAWEESRHQFHTLLQGSTDVFEVTDRKMLYELVIEAVGRLPEKERVVVAGLYLEDIAPQEMAQHLAVSKAYVYKLQKTGIRRLRGMLSRLMHERKE